MRLFPSARARARSRNYRPRGTRDAPRSRVYAGETPEAVAPRYKRPAGKDTGCAAVELPSCGHRMRLRRIMRRFFLIMRRFFMICLCMLLLLIRTCATALSGAAICAGPTGAADAGAAPWARPKSAAAAAVKISFFMDVTPLWTSSQAPEATQATASRRNADGSKFVRYRTDSRAAGLISSAADAGFAAHIAPAGPFR